MKISVKYIAFIINIGFLFSCQNEKDCHSKIKDDRTLNEYFVKIDSCKIWKNYCYHEYFSSKGLAMSGYGDRLFKQGEWSFYYSGKKIATGEFRDGKPIGTWESDLVNVKNWKIIKGGTNDFEISIPSSWWNDNSEDSKFSILTSINKESVKDVNLNIVVTDYDLSISEYITKHNDTLNNLGYIKELDYKELFTEGFNEVYQRKFKIEQENNETLVFQTLFGQKTDNKVFVITVSSKYDSYRKFEPYLSSMVNSFRVYE